MIFRGVEIAIAGGVREMVRAPISLSVFLLFFFFCNLAFIVARYKILLQCELWRKQNL